MHIKYFIDPKIIERLDNSVIGERLRGRLKDRYSGESNLPECRGFIDELYIKNVTTQLKNDGYFSTMPEKEIKSFQKQSNEIFEHPEKHPWKVKRYNKETEEETELKHLQMMLGWEASYFLSPDEIWDYKKFGFSSITEFTGTVAAYIIEKIIDDSSNETGLVWKSKRKNGIILLNEVGGSHHYDPVVTQLDATIYETVDPFGNKVRYRPRTINDTSYLNGAQETESDLFVSILRYIDQSGIKSKSLENGGKELIEWTRSLGQCSGASTEHLSPNISSSRSMFKKFDRRMSRIDKNGDLDTRPRDYLSTGIGEPYIICIGPENELVFLNYKEKRHVDFFPEEIDDLLKGMMFQAAKGLGRVPAIQLINLLEYNLSVQYEIDKK